MYPALAFAALLGVGAPAVQGPGRDQARRPTVGDTIWLELTVTVPAGAEVRPAEWRPDGAVELLGTPLVLSEGGRARVRYPAVAWSAGTHSIDIPGPVLLLPSGELDSLPAEQVTIRVSSILPALPDDSLRPQPPASLVRRRSTSPLPLLVFWAVAGVILAPLAWAWRRRGKPVALSPAAEVPQPPLERWAEAGERRAVAAVAAAQLRVAIAQKVPDAHLALDPERVLRILAVRRPGWPRDEIARVLRQLEGARFAPLAPSESAALARRAEELATTLSGTDP